MQINIFFNGRVQTLSQETSLADFIELQGLAQTACATAVNGQFVARADRIRYVLKPQDQVMTFEPITGG
jgi:thiamine biosynthesis protein ThiS